MKNFIQEVKQIIFASKNTFKHCSVFHKILIFRHAFGTFDTNHDGSIDFDEFLISIAASSGADYDHRLAFAFSL